MKSNFDNFAACMQQAPSSPTWGRSVNCGFFRIPSLIHSRFNRLGNGTHGHVVDIHPQDPILISPEEFGALLGSVSYLNPKFLERFEPFYELREQRKLGLGFDDFWGLIDPPNALMAVALALHLAANRNRKLRVLVLGTGVGLLEKVLLETIMDIQIVSVDISPRNSSPTQKAPRFTIDAKNQTYQVKNGQEVGMFIDQADIDSGRAKLIHSDALDFLATDEIESSAYDMIVIDDNHIANHVIEEVKAIRNRGLLAENGVLFLDNISFPGTTGPATAALTQIVPHSMFFIVSKKDGPSAACGFWINAPESNYSNNCHADLLAE